MFHFGDRNLFFQNLFEAPGAHCLSSNSRLFNVIVSMPAGESLVEDPQRLRFVPKSLTLGR